MDLSARIGNLIIDPAISISSGIFSQPHILEKMAEYDAGAVFIKSVGLNPRKGNMEPTVVQATNETLLNAMGLPNPGYRNLREELKEIYPLRNGKKLICSVFGDTEEEIVEVAKGVEDYCDGLEANYSCPNIREGEKTGVTIGRDPKRVESFTQALTDNVKKPVIVKLTPHVYDIGEVAQAAEHAGAAAISAINTVPGGMVIDIYAERPVLSAKYGGVSGRGILPIGVGAVYKIYESVKIPIIGGGGATRAEDVIQYVEAGADVVGLGTAFYQNGRVLSTEQIGTYLKDLRLDIEKILDKKNKSSLKELKGVAHA